MPVNRYYTLNTKVLLKEIDDIIEKSNKLLCQCAFKNIYASKELDSSLTIEENSIVQNLEKMIMMNYWKQLKRFK